MQGKAIDNTKVSFQIAIIGFGPKGLYALERLMAQVQNATISQPIEVHLFNRTSFFGSGDVYRSDQPLSLLMNYANHNIQFKNQSLPALKINQFQDFLPWLANKTNKKIENIQFEYSPRAVVGSFLEYCFKSLLNHLPQTLKVHTHTATVIDVISLKGEYKIITKENKPLITVKNILFATGHFWNRQKVDVVKENKSYIDFIYPVAQKLFKIPNSAKIAIKGMGLTFIDAVLALTEKREGSFKINNEGFYTYSETAKTPLKIYPFSRTGLPMVPRTGIPDLEQELYFFTEKNLVLFLQGKKADFEEDLLPLLIKEFKLAYYKTAFKQVSYPFNKFTTHQEFEGQVEKFHMRFPKVEKWNWNTLVNPFPHQKEVSHHQICDYIATMCHSALAKKGTSPIMEAIAIWRKASPLFNKIYSFGGLTAASQKKFDQYYFGVFNRLSYGPPVSNMLKILALAKAGIIDFRFARSAKLETSTTKKGYHIFNTTSSTSIDVFINATIPRAAGNKNKSGLFQNLLKKDFFSEFVNISKENYKTGSVNINKKGKVIGKNGKLQSNLSCYGTPTEGITFDNDTLSNSRNNFSNYWAKDIVNHLKN